jgi:hypothetical protein
VSVPQIKSADIRTDAETAIHDWLHKYSSGSLKGDEVVRNMFLRLLISIDGLSPILWAPEVINGVDQGFLKHHPWLNSNTHIRGLRKKGANCMAVALDQCFKA